MASILNHIKKKNPNATYADATKALGMPSQEDLSDDNDNNIIEDTQDDETQPENPELMDDVLSQTNTPDNPQQKNELPPLPEQRIGTELKQADNTAKQSIADEEAVNDLIGRNKQQPEEPAKEAPTETAASTATTTPDVKMPTGTEATKENLLGAQQQENKDRQNSILARSLAQAGAAIGHQSKSVLDQNLQLIDSMSQQGKIDKEHLTERIALEKQDPNSDYSKATRAFYKETFGKDLPEGISGQNVIDTMLKIGVPKAKIDAAMAQKVLSIGQQQKKLEEDTIHHRADEENSKLHAAALANNTGSKFDLAAIRGYQQASKKIADEKNTYNKMMTSADNVFNTLQLDPKMDISSLENLDTSNLAKKLETDKELNKKSRIAAKEIAMEVARLVSQGNSTVSTISGLTPDNINSWKAKAEDFFSNNMNSAGQAEYLKLMLSIAHRVREQNRLKAHDQFNMLKSVNDPIAENSKNPVLKKVKENFENEFGKIYGSQTQSEITPELQKYAKEHGLTDQQALDIQKLRQSKQGQQ